MKVYLHSILVCCGALGVLIASGCASPMVTIAPTPPPHAEKLGKTTGDADGWMLFGPSAYNFIPAGLNSRYQRAYAKALANKPGATALTDVTIQENWYWVVIGTIRHVSITGEAVK